MLPHHLNLFMTVSGFKKPNTWGIRLYLGIWFYGKKVNQYARANRYWHGENWSHGIQGGDEDADLTDPSSQQQSPGGFSVSFPMTKHLRAQTGVMNTWAWKLLWWYLCQLCVCLTCKKGTMPSRAMACSRRGAPVKLCSPAPQQEKKEPITMTQGEGQDSVPITRFPFTESPNLQCRNIIIYINWTIFLYSAI